MESTSSLFSLSIDPVTKAHLAVTSRWAKILAVCGFILLGIVLLFGIILIAGLSTELGGNIQEEYNKSSMFKGLSIGAVALSYIISALITFIPLLFLFRFANRMQTSLKNNDQQSLNFSFQNLKAYFLFLGVLAIIMLAFILISVVFTIIGATALS